MKTDAPRIIRRDEYTPPTFAVENVALEFDLAPQRSRVRAQLHIRRRPGLSGPLMLDGDPEVTLLSLRLNGRDLPEGAYSRTPNALVLNDPPEEFMLTMETLVNPAANSRLEGLYLSNGVFCTQCEAEGFRRITFFPDRPDVTARYRVTLRADGDSCPVLLSNGNLTKSGSLPDGRRYAVWEDPFPKPCYLFALVAGDLAHIEDVFTTRSGRRVRLRIYTEHGAQHRAGYAMDCLKRAMRWDETRFGLEYDLDVFNIVAVADFNMGAMENKSLNIFNAACVLADPETATDDDHAFVESVVGHEYFHNWTGNRVTCRDWFQLSLKEGLTVFRDQEFSADMNSRAVKRIEDVRLLRARQFPEDAGPLAHPVRPESYVEINNFYTATVYEKGAELVRMLHTLLGEEGFRAGLSLYLTRHDGQAATCDDFLAAMAAATHTDLDRFARWYSHAGTPRIAVETGYDAAAKVFTLTLTQSGAADVTAPLPEQQALHIPLRMALLDEEGAEMAVHPEATDAPPRREHLLQLTAPRRSFRFFGVESPPQISLNRGFSAPVILNFKAGCAPPPAFAMTRDRDPFVRWNAAQTHAAQLILNAAAAPPEAPVADDALLRAMAEVAADESYDHAFRALMLTLPPESSLVEQMTPVDVVALHRAREGLRRQIGQAHAGLFDRLYRATPPQGTARFDAAATGRRALRNIALGLLAAADPDAAPGLLQRHFDTADGMTDRVAALRLLTDIDCPEREAAFADFRRRWADNAQVMDKWFALQAASTLPDALPRVQRLSRDPLFTLTNPNRARALIGGFCRGNMLRFHAADGEGYRFLRDMALRLDRINPQSAARLLEPLGSWRRFDAPRRAAMRQVLDDILAVQGLSADMVEIAGKMRG